MKYCVKVMIQSIKKRKRFLGTTLDVTFIPVQEASFEGYFLCRLANDATRFKIFQQQTLELKDVKQKFEPLLLALAKIRRPLIIKIQKRENSEKIKLIEIQAEY